MCFGSPSPPPAPAPAPVASDYSAGADAMAAKQNQRKKIAAAQGYQATILTGAQGDTTQASVDKRVLLGRG